MQVGSRIDYLTNRNAGGFQIFGIILFLQSQTIQYSQLLFDAVLCRAAKELLDGISPLIAAIAVVVVAVGRGFAVITAAISRAVIAVLWMAVKAVAGVEARGDGRGEDELELVELFLFFKGKGSILQII